MSTSVPAGSPPDARVARVLARLSEAARGAASPDALFGAACEAVRDVLGPAYLPSIYVAGPHGLWLAAQRGYAGVIHTLPFGSGVFATAFTSGTPVAIFADAEDDARYVPAIDRVEACLAVPFRAGRDGALLGLEVLQPVDEDVLAALEATAAALAELIDALPAAARVATS